MKNVGETIVAIEQCTTDLANATDTLTKEAQKKEIPRQSRALIPKDVRGETVFTDDLFARKPFIRESTAHLEGGPSDSKPDDSRDEGDKRKKDGKRGKDNKKPKARDTTMNQTTVVGTAIPKEACAKWPKPFNGKKGKEVETFITKMEIYFNDYEEGSFRDQCTIHQTPLNMASGDAANWAQPLIRSIATQEDHKFLQSWVIFKRAFLLNFGDPVKKEKAIQELGRLTQIQSIQAYATQFRNLAQEVEWNCEALIDKFKEGLKSDMRQELLKMELHGALEDFSLKQWIATAC